MKMIFVPIPTKLIWFRWFLLVPMISSGFNLNYNRFQHLKHHNSSRLLSCKRVLCHGILALTRTGSFSNSWERDRFLGDTPWHPSVCRRLWRRRLVCVCEGGGGEECVDVTALATKELCWCCRVSFAQYPNWGVIAELYPNFGGFSQWTIFSWTNTERKNALNLCLTFKPQPLSLPNLPTTHRAHSRTRLYCVDISCSPFYIPL